MIEILHLEDDAADAELLERELVRSGLEVSVHRVVTGAAFEDALLEKRWDVVITDHRVPGFGGREALERTLALAPGTPCILFTGTLDEETAVGYMKAGAADFLLKDRPARIGAALESALEHAERQRELAWQRALLEQVLDSAPALICVKDAGGRFLLANRATCEAFGVEAARLLGRTEIEVGADPEEAEARGARHAEVLRSGRAARSMEEPFTPPGGTAPRWFQVIWGPLSLPEESERLVVTIATDVTEARELAAQLHLGARLESVGRLAGGVAHDFNNLLMLVTGNAELLLRKAGPDDPSRGALEQILDAAGRAGSLTRQLLAFGRRQDLHPRVVELDAVIAEAEPMLRRVLPAGVELVVEAGGEGGAIRADPGQIEHVLLNLAVNAADAMPDGGRLTIETARVEVAPGDPPAGSVLEAGSYLRLAVSDTGVGMDEETRRRVFEPFFTTKGEEQGSGLGLASVYGTVRQSSGFIRVESSPGRGARFEIHLPRLDAGG